MAAKKKVEDEHEYWWRYFVENYNDVCPICVKRIEKYESGIEHNRTRRSTSVFFHRKCVGSKGE